MTKDELQTLRGLCERAVSGPWHTQPDGAGMTEVYSDKLHCDGFNIGIADDLREHDAAFIAAARSALPAALDRVEELERERDEARNRVLRPLTEREVQAALHEGRAEAMAATGDNAWTSLLTARDKLAAECEDLRKQSESWRMAHFAWQQWGDRMRDVVHCSANGDEPTREAIEHRARSWRDQRDSARTRALKAEADRDRLRTLLAEAVEIGMAWAARLRDQHNDPMDRTRLAAIASEGGVK